MKDFQIDLLDFEINDLNNSTPKAEIKDVDPKFENSLDFSGNLKNNEQTLNEIAFSNNLVENIIFPDDDEMPQLDDDIINTETTGGGDILPNSIQPLSDADIVFNSAYIDEIKK